MIGVLGDVHGDTPWLRFAAALFGHLGVTEVLQVGDFGFWPGDDAFLRRAEAALAAANVTLRIAPGNHEDYPQIAALPRNAEGWHVASPHLLAAPRGQRWAHGGRTFVLLGGAPSVDRAARRAGISWWPEEAITVGDVMRTVAGGAADVLVTHDAPADVPTIEATLAARKPPAGADPEDLAEGRRLIAEAALGVRPRLLLHGHYHLPVDEVVDLGAGPLRVVGLDKNRASHSLALLDVPPLRLAVAGAELLPAWRRWKATHLGGAMPPGWRPGAAVTGWSLRGE